MLNNYSKYDKDITIGASHYDNISPPPKSKSEIKKVIKNTTKVMESSAEAYVDILRDAGDAFHTIFNIFMTALMPKGVLDSQHNVDGFSTPEENIDGKVRPKPYHPHTHFKEHVNFDNVTLGEEIGEGSYKNTYVVLDEKGKPTGKVISIAKDPNEDLLEELKLIQKLGRMGFPVFLPDAVGRYEGYPAMISHQMLTSVKPVQVSELAEDLKNSDYVTKETVRSLQKIRHLLDKHNTSIKDLQLLVDSSNGKLYIHDPLKIREGTTFHTLYPGAEREVFRSREFIDKALEILYKRFPNERPIK